MGSFSSGFEVLGDWVWRGGEARGVCDEIVVL
jgi:hypothetical protein